MFDYVDFGITSRRDLPAEARAAIRDFWDDALSAPEWEGPPVWPHGDLHPANVVVSCGTLSGVIDFGELCAGDPATVRRARGWAVLRGIGLMAIGGAGEQGLPCGRPTWGPPGRRALDRVLVSGRSAHIGERFLQPVHIRYGRVRSRGAATG
jgi:hypothetical protein